MAKIKKKAKGKKTDNTNKERQARYQDKSVTVTLDKEYLKKIAVLADRYGVAAPDLAKIKRAVVSKLIDDAVTITPKKSTKEPDLSGLRALAKNHKMPLQTMLDTLVTDYGRVSYEDKLTAKVLAGAGAHATRQEVLDILKAKLMDRYKDKACYSSSTQTDPVKEECWGIYNRVRAKLKYQLDKTRPTA